MMVDKDLHLRKDDTNVLPFRAYTQFFHAEIEDLEQVEFLCGWLMTLYCRGFSNGYVYLNRQVHGDGLGHIINVYESLTNDSCRIFAQTYLTNMFEYLLILSKDPEKELGALKKLHYFVDNLELSDPTQKDFENKYLRIMALIDKFLKIIMTHVQSEAGRDLKRKKLSTMSGKRFLIKKCPKIDARK